MNTPKIISGLSATLMALLSVSTAKAIAFYGNFETADFTGWTVSIPHGSSEFPPTDRPAGSADVISSFALPATTYPEGSAVSPKEGSYFAAIGTSGNAFFTNYEATYDISASQSFSVNAGDTLSGWAAFYNGDYEPQDTAWVSIRNISGVPLSTPWQAISGGLGGDTPTTPYQTATAWTQWEWAAPETGTYTLQLGVTTFGDDRFASYGFFDDIKVVPAETPEPSSSLVLVAGLTALFGYRKKSWKRGL